MSNKIELKLNGSANEYDFFWDEEYVATIGIRNGETPKLIDTNIQINKYLNQPELLRVLADILESLNKKVL